MRKFITPLLIIIGMACGRIHGQDSPILHPKPAPESAEIQELRRTAQSMADGAVNLIAVYDQTVGRRDRYEVRVVDGRQIPSVTPTRSSKPGLFLGPEWSMLPRLIGTEYSLKIVKVDEGHFTFTAPAESKVAYFTNCVFRCRTYTIGTHGEVWTAPDGRITTILQVLDTPARVPWKRLQIVVHYAPLDNPKHAMAPVAIQFMGELRGKPYAVAGTFTDYHQFMSTVELRAEVQP